MAAPRHVTSRAPRRVLLRPRLRREFPGEIEKVLTWFRDYKIPDGKPANKFGYDNKCMDKAFTMKVRVQVAVMVVVVVVVMVRGGGEREALLPRRPARVPRARRAFSGARAVPAANARGSQRPRDVAGPRAARPGAALVAHRVLASSVASFIDRKKSFSSCS